MRAKTATAAIWVDCPKCLEPCASPDSGSLMWAEMDVDFLVKHSDGKHTCTSCGHVMTVTFPKR
jgi:hypothetical protein